MFAQGVFLGSPISSKSVREKSSHFKIANSWVARALTWAVGNLIQIISVLKQRPEPPKDPKSHCEAGKQYLSQL